MRKHILFWTVTLLSLVYTMLLSVDILAEEYEFVNKWPDEVLGLRSPSGVAVDSLGNVYVVDSATNRVIKYNSSGSVLLTIG